jgi:hypothetical protein
LPYIPGLTQPNQGLTTIAPGSSYQIISRDAFATTKWSITYPGSDVDRLPAAINVKTPLFMIGLDKNSIVVPISSYALGENSPLSSIGQMRLTNGTYASINQFNAADVKNGLYFGDTHFRPNSAYRLRNRVPFTFFAPLQSEMGDAWATGANDDGQLGMGFRYSDVGYTRLYGNWDKVVISETHAAALSTCGTKKKLFVCGGNAYGQLGLTNVAISQPALTETQTVWKQLQNIWTWVWDDSGETYYYRNILDSEDILDVEVGDDFTLIKTDVQLYGCGRMSNMGIAAPGANYGSDYQFQDVRGNSFDSFYVPYFTSFLQRSAPIFFYYNNGADFTSYTNIPSNSVKKFQARGAHWFYLNTDGRLYGQGKLGPSGNSVANNPITMPVGATDQRLSLIFIVPGYVSTTQLYGPGNPNTRYNEQFYGDFESNQYCIAALSANYKTWLVHGPTNVSSSGKGNPSLSTICLFDPNQNAYVPQNDYFLRVYPSWLGFMANYNGKLYFTPNGAFMNQGFDAGGVNGAGTGIISRLPASTLPVLNNALGANPTEKANLRTLVPLTYMGQPDISWKSLFTSFNYSAAIDVNNKLYVTGFNSLASSGIDAKSLLGFPSATSNIYTFTKVNEENIYNANTNHANLVVYKTNRNPAPSPVPIPSPTPTPSVTPITLLPSTVNNAIINTLRTANVRSQGDTLYWYYSSDLYTTPNRTVWAYLPSSRTVANVNYFTNFCFDFKDDDNAVVATMVKNAQGNYDTLKQTIRNKSTWNVSGSLNDIGTNSTTIATWQSADFTGPFFSPSSNVYGKVDMFVHRNSNTAVYVVTQLGDTYATHYNTSTVGVAGAWSFTVNLANNAVSNAVKISNENLAINRTSNNNSMAYSITQPYVRTTRPLTKLPDGRIIFKSLYLTGDINSNYGAVAKVGYYNQATWNGFTESITYVIPGTSEYSNNSQAPNNAAPAFCEFAALGSNYYLAWCTVTNTNAKNSTPLDLVLRNLQTGVQVNVDSLLNTDAYLFGNRLMQPYDIIAVPSSRQIYVVYTKFINFTGDYSSINNTYGTFLKRYDSNLNLISTSNLFTFNPRDGYVGNIYPSLGSPKFSYKVSSTGVLTLILSFGYAIGGSVNINGAGTLGDVIMTNTPSINSTWTTVLNRTGGDFVTPSTSIYYPSEGRSLVIL